MKRASELAERQFGVIARRQLLECGFGVDRVRSWVRRGHLHPVLPRVYAYGRRGLGTEGELAAALLYAGPGAALGGITSLWWQALLGRRPALTNVDTPRRVRHQPGIAPRQVASFTRHLHDDLPVTALPHALLAAAADLSHDSLRLVLARAEFRNRLSLPSLHAALGPGRAGSAAVRAALAAHLPQLAACSSPLEVDFLLLCERFGLPLPEPNARIGRWRPDMLWREARLIVELDGRDAHGTAAQLAADRRREEALRALGYEVLRFAWPQVHDAPEAVAAILRDRLG